MIRQQLLEAICKELGVRPTQPILEACERLISNFNYWARTEMALKPLPDLGGEA